MNDHLGFFAPELRAMHERINEIRVKVKPQGYDSDDHPHPFASAEAMRDWSYHDGILRMTSVVLATLADDAEEDRRDEDEWPNCFRCGSLMRPLPPHTAIPENRSMILKGGVYYLCSNEAC